MNKELEKLFKEAKNIKPKLNLTAKEMDELTEEDILERQRRANS